ncbi:GTP pyrophosphokinase [Marinobacter maritimus]|uniref:GTP pyrophosphokinase n=1 Tax=Marinobacter maritimus TaxID=277961 RepID=UPI00119E0295|nr:RelA/SpoT domain-containing protein [Marinobacter maritimus]|tara:strand:+ start:682 stop:1665 length:984 start_codon:yes stop_codon:yes gene_type:complete
MNESEFVEKWHTEKPVYKAWGRYLVEIITQKIKDREIEPKDFFKVLPSVRLKDDGSLVDKAFYRPGKNYSDPYAQIEDKVGVRFIVLLLEDISSICKIIESEKIWEFDRCKHFDEDRAKEPLLFTYQSVHYILRPKIDLEFDGVNIPRSTACEVQIRTLLQHAHAELTHDAIYKSKRTVQPAVHRTVAKSMALIETTDEFFADVTTQLNFGPAQEHAIPQRLDGIYTGITGYKPHNQKSSIVIWDAFEQFLDECLIDNIQRFVESNPHIPEVIKSRYHFSNLYQQSVVLFVYWLLKRKRRRLLRDWPLPKEILEPLANDVGVSTWDE